MALYYTGNARNPAQAAEMERLEAAGTCLFCPSPPIKPVLHRTEHWRVVANDYPYAGTALHLMLVPDAHVADLLDLDPPVQADFWVALGWVRAHHDLRFYGLGARCGDCRFTGVTIEHVHVHVVVGDVEGPEDTPVRLKLSSRPAPGRDRPR